MCTSTRSSHARSPRAPPLVCAPSVLPAAHRPVQRQCAAGRGQEEAKGEEKVTKESFKPVSFNVEEAEKPAAAAAPAKSSPFGDKVSLKRQWRDESGVMAWC